MKFFHNICIYSFASFGLIIVLLFNPGPHGIAHAEERKLVVVAEAWPPFEFEENGKAAGIGVDIMSQLFKKMGVDFEIRILPWARAWKMIEAGKVDAAASVSRKKERMQYLSYPKEDVWVSEYLFFVRRDKKKTSSMSYARAGKENLKIGIIKDNSYHESFWEAFPKRDGELNERLEEAADAETNLRKLAKGRIDLYIVDKIIGRYLISMMNLEDEITWYDNILFSKGYTIAFVKKSGYPRLKQIEERFEKELKRLKKSGQYNEIQKKWIKENPRH